jgi:hypothetical protein
MIGDLVRSDSRIYCRRSVVRMYYKIYGRRSIARIYDRK